MVDQRDKDFFFIERTGFDKTFYELEKNKAPYLRISGIASVLVTLIVAFFTTEKYVSILDIPQNLIKNTVLFLIILLGILLLTSITIKIIYFKKNRWEKLTVDLVKDALERNSEELNEYNILLIIPDFSDNKFTFLAKKHANWRNAIFLPYISYKSKEEFMNLDKLDENIHKFIMTDIKFEFIHIPEMDISNSVKYHKDEHHLRRYNYKFFLVYPTSNFLIDIFINELKKEKAFDFFSIDIMKSDLSSIVKKFRCY
jgi:hypothetical protein